MSKLLKATHDGTLQLANMEIPCAVLEDSTRVLNERRIANILGRRGSGAYWKRKKEQKGAHLPEYISIQELQPFISDELRKKLSNPIDYISLQGNRARGFKADLLPEICNVWLDAREKGALSKTRKKVAFQAEILMRGLAHIGIIALVDEATGYQYDRARRALEKILESFIAKELLAWAKRFPDEFYEHMFRLRGWNYNPISVKRPSVVGKMTTDLVYERLAPGVLDELKRITPRDSKGRLKHHYHRRLTEEIGHPALKEHLAVVVAFMKVSTSWDGFYRLLQRARPKLNEQLLLEYPEGNIPANSSI